MKRKYNNKSSYILLGIVFCVVALILLLALLLRGEEIRTSYEKENIETSILYCESSSPISPFFVSNTAIDAKHIIKVIIRGDEPYRISYNYYGQFRNKYEAETANAMLHGDYNNYMGKHGIDSGLLYPTFLPNDTKIKINLYAEKTQVNKTTGIFFFLDENSSEQFGQNDIEALKKVLESKNFKCKVNR